MLHLRPDTDLFRQRRLVNFLVLICTLILTKIARLSLKSELASELSKLPPPDVVVVVGLLLLSLAGSGGEEDEAGSVAETDMEDVAGVADEEAAVGEEVDVASCQTEDQFFSSSFVDR